MQYFSSSPLSQHHGSLICVLSVLFNCWSCVRALRGLTILVHIVREAIAQMMQMMITPEMLLPSRGGDVSVKPQPSPGTRSGRRLERNR
ncbi:hypothetical protein C8J55DRAFT_54411 [Lentinula edodes]|uniref:Uncharacterized protein n=1 Tax=Lentinula lateritia TaxID=40482 RepID=A0A9W9AGB9_9AGAR|nr:hypothetical protein C8J55DRAFT_54411 [Lentinula edodes]